MLIKIVFIAKIGGIGRIEKIKRGEASRV